MLFVSYEFIAFLAVLFILYYVIPKRFQWILLLAASYVFYWFAGPKCLIFIAATTVVVYLSGIAIEKINTNRTAYIKAHKAEMTAAEKKEFKAKEKKKSHLVFLAGLLISLGVLAVLKYTNFVINNVNSFLSESDKLNMVDLVLPMGISFYTFQAVGYLIDINNEKYPAQHNFFKFALFVSFFPQLVQGPISRYNDLSLSLYEEHEFNGKTVTFGLQRILWGYFKKMVVADRILVAVNSIIQSPETYSGVYVVLGMLFYAVQLYCDFTGGIDITIGIAETLGISVKENFDRPFLSKNIEEYWRRWHITMGSWFRDYIFYPLMVSKSMMNLGKWAKGKFGDNAGRKLPVYLSTIIVWFATGIWHGASWNFIVWGLLNGVIIIISQEISPLYAWFHSKTKVGETKLYDVFQIVRTFCLMSLLRSLDCYRNVGMTFKMIGTIFTTPNWGELFNGGLLNLGLNYGDYIVALVGFIIVCIVSVKGIDRPVREKLSEKPAAVRYAAIIAVLLVIIIFGAYGIGFDASQFIYNQF